MQLSRVGLPLRFITLALLSAQEERDAVPSSWHPWCSGLPILQST